MIRVVPRRKGACLFFCGNHRNDYGNHGKRDQYQYQEQQQQQYANSRDPYGKNKKDEPKRGKKVDAKYSYCKETESANGHGESQKSKQCTDPLESKQHVRKMDQNDRYFEEEPDEFAYDLAG
eukprot:61579_1